MNIRKSGARLSAIISIGEKIKKLAGETGQEYLYLNRGINSVCNIDLSEVVREINFNSNEIQVYPPAKGSPLLREAIATTYFGSKTPIENISVTGGGMQGLDLSFQTLDVEKIYFPEFHWGTYFQVLTIRDRRGEVYENFDELNRILPALKKSAVVICDPNNPLGNKTDDRVIIELIGRLNQNGTIIIFDSPYRSVFFDETDTLYSELLRFENVIIVDSFSKSVGLSGQRIGFVHSTNKEFIAEFDVRLMYATNGINAFSQALVQKLLATAPGKKAVTEFRKKTTVDIARNIRYLESKKLLATQFYDNTPALGIFVIVNKSEDELLKHRIGSVSLSYFTRTKKEMAQSFARICVSEPHEKFTSYFDKIL